MAALRRLAGTDRVVFYDVPEEGAAERSSPASPYVRGSVAWWDFVARRRSLDDGQNLTLLVSLRGLRTPERMLIVNWGTAFANAFLLIEPSDPWLDLTTEEGLREMEREYGRPTVDETVRAAYADWVYWYQEPEGELESHLATLPLANGKTLWETIWQKLPQTFPEADFLSSLTILNLRELELFTGGRQVGRAITPFLTRLGLPILYDARIVMRGVRELVNAGLAWVQDPQDNWRVYKGPWEPIPNDVSEERIAAMLR